MYGLPTIQTKGGCSRMGTRLVGAITNCFPSSRSYMEAGAAPPEGDPARDAATTRALRFFHQM